MTPELFFIYDSHCPWSYASTALLNEIEKSCPEMTIHLWHCAHYDGSDRVGHEKMDRVAKESVVKFGQQYKRFVDSPKNAIMTANFMAWLQNKQPEKELGVLNALQKAHFIEGNPFGCKHDFNEIVEQFKLSPPNKIFKDELSSESEYTLSDISEVQEFMKTTDFPALLLIVDEKAVLLNHSLYLSKPEAIIEAIKQELA
ncbi:protein-disulfide isomerase [Psychromonas sp. MB-3u-54]|uniref:protein-disulfide isomerase n=1 Tax=Psychromonas sp. MB-3u-54 TaxID=2058319 RepID=UPI000C325D7B|nr:protein-disulfide isomerase [Psychromonas sp. MB-3u-54]PKH02814.1 protein-disulfide isomerase [Psychromonas sp. MB-3u-54]